ncbi:GNAT family N-acetyltransferase [Alicyclobacillus dauci]|uniref:GNAT family N-acetyltransferase n=1 Tax=Alicyclobacillus dauci TaxID=1475485 RepID=A0ABY6Z589_9BACL|nr:GNAT family N-acetyltransferase [Alicyclobacillus dauci]WAH37822.1 GNAT family N-acetyltransferase [Alicyclobacillus dauci]
MDNQVDGVNVSRVEELNAGHVNDVMRLIDRVGWSVPMERLRLHFRVGQVLGYFNDNTLAGTVTIFPWQKDIVGVGNLIVHPAYQRRGIGQRLLEHAMSAGDVRVQLIATDEGYPLYRKNGFQVTGEIVRLSRNASPGADGHPAIVDKNTRVYRVTRVSDMDEADLQCLIDFDRRVSQVDRATLYRGLCHSLDTYIITATANFDELGGAIVYALEGDRIRIGPVLGQTPAHARRLFETCIGDFHGPVNLDMLADSKELLSAAERAGFTASRTSPFMERVGSLPPLSNTGRFALFDAAMG